MTLDEQQLGSREPVNPPREQPDVFAVAEVSTRLRQNAAVLMDLDMRSATTSVARSHFNALQGELR